jgi:hypothetical protein
VDNKRIGSMHEVLLKTTPRENLMQGLQCTTFANAVTSMSRLQYALNCGMNPADGMNYRSSAACRARLPLECLSSVSGSCESW